MKETGLYVWDVLSEALTNEQSCELIRQYRETGDKKIRDKVVFGNMRLINGCAHKFFHSFCHSSKYSVVEDLAQEAIFAAMNAVEKFDLEKGVAFSTYLTQSIQFRFCILLRKVKKEKPVVSLNTPLLTDEPDTEFQDLLQDKCDYRKMVEDKTVFRYINENILCLISKKERDLFIDYHVNGMTCFQLADKHGVSHQNINKTVKFITERIFSIIENGVSEFDRLMAGTRPTAAQKKKIELGCALKNKYGRENLIENFMPKLSEDKAKIFKHIILDYYGQPVKEICEEFQLKDRGISAAVDSILKKLSKYENSLKKTKDDFQDNVVTEERKFVNKILTRHGQKFFLYKYFLPALTEVEKKVFKSAVLDYDDQSYQQLAQNVGLDETEFRKVLLDIENKLIEINFDILIEVLDNSETFGTTLAPLNISKIRNIAKRKDIVNELGGVIRLKNYFYPLLSKTEKLVLLDMYLNPKFDSMRTFAKFYGVSIEKAYEKEVSMLKKLKLVNLAKREELCNHARSKMVSHSMATKNDETQSLNQSCISDILLIRDRKKRLLAAQSYLKKFGSIPDITEDFLPSLKKMSTQKMFVYCLIDCFSTKEVQTKLNLSTEKFLEEIDELENQIKEFKKVKKMKLNEKNT